MENLIFQVWGSGVTVADNDSFEVRLMVRMLGEGRTGTERSRH